MPRVREAALDEPAGETLNQRLRAYLMALALPETLLEDWVARAGKGGADAGLAFRRLRTLMADYWREQGNKEHVDDVTAVAQFRLCRWLVSELKDTAPECLPNLERLMALPPIHRQSMVPESWEPNPHE